MYLQRLKGRDLFEKIYPQTTYNPNAVISCDEKLFLLNSPYLIHSEESLETQDIGTR